MSNEIETPAENLITVGDKQYTPDQLQAAIAENESLQGFKGKDDILSIGSEIKGFLDRGADGLRDLRNMLDAAEKELGVNVPTAKSLDINLDEYATDNERKIATALKQLETMLLSSGERLDMTKRKSSSTFKD